MRRPAAVIAALLLTISGCVASTEGTALDLVPCDAAQAADQCGGVATLVDAAEAEGELVIAGDPERNPQFAALAKAFAKEYRVDVSWSVPASAKTDTPKVDALILEPGSEPPPAEQLARYHIQNFSRLPQSALHDEDRWTSVYAAVMAVGYNATELGELNSIAELDARKQSRVGVPGDARTTAATTHAILMMDGRTGTRVSGDGLRQISQWAKSGQLSPDYTSEDRLADGRQNVALDWNTVQQSHAKALEGAGIDWRFFVPAGGEVAGTWSVAVSAHATHPAAARLWIEYCFSSDAQVALLRSGGMPTLYHYLVSLGDIDNATTGSLPYLLAPPWTPQPSDVIAVREQAEAAWPRLFPSP